MSRTMNDILQIPAVTDKKYNTGIAEHQCKQKIGSMMKTKRIRQAF